MFVGLSPFINDARKVFYFFPFPSGGAVPPPPSYLCLHFYSEFGDKTGTGPTGPARFCAQICLQRAGAQVPKDLAHAFVRIGAAPHATKYGVSARASKYLKKRARRRRRRGGCEGRKRDTNMNWRGGRRGDGWWVDGTTIIFFPVGQAS